MAVFSQHHVDGLDLALTPLAYMLASFPNTKDQEHRWDNFSLWEAQNIAIFINKTFDQIYTQKVLGIIIPWAVLLSL